MKILLINPNSDIAVKGSRYRASMSFIPPVGIAYLIAKLTKEKEFDVQFEDQFASADSNEYIINRVKQYNPDIVGFSCLSPSLSNIKRLSGLIKGINPDIKIILGNLHATVFSEEMLSEGVGDIVVRGEGEYTLTETVSAILRGRDLHSVRGISFLSDGKIINNPACELVEDLDDLPYPAWQKFNFDLYKRYPMLGIYNKIILPIQASRGCPHRCIFCSQNTMYEKPRYRSIDSVLNEIEYMHYRFKARYFGFNDAFFPFSIEHGLEFCERLMGKGLHRKIQWITETRVDRVNEKLLKKMKEAGLKLVMYGFEAGNQSILDSINKKTTLKQAEEAMYYTRKAKVKSLGLFMLGLPEDTEDTCRQTIEFAMRIKPDIAKFNLTIPQPGSRLYETCKNDLRDVRPEEFTSWSNWISSGNRAVYTPPMMTSEKLLSLQRNAMFRFYMDPWRILSLLRKRSFSIRDFCWGAKLLIYNYLKDIFESLKAHYALKQDKRL
jgi:radical SAM superfamily enzyme YgiQ (UPF0313 family)